MDEARSVPATSGFLTQQPRDQSRASAPGSGSTLSVDVDSSLCSSFLSGARSIRASSCRLGELIEVQVVRARVRPGTGSSGPISCSCSLSVIKGRSASRRSGSTAIASSTVRRCPSVRSMAAASNRSRVETDLDPQLGARHDGDGERIMGPLQVSSRLDAQPVGAFLQRGNERQVLDDHDALEQAASRAALRSRLGYARAESPRTAAARPWSPGAREASGTR